MDNPEKNEHSYYDEGAHHAEPQEQLHKETNEESRSEDKYHEDDNTHALRTLLSWHAPGRPYREKGKEYYVNILLISLFVGVILLLFHEYLLILVLASLVFLSYALSVTPPGTLFYKISTEGVMVEDHFYIWDELYDFYFKQKDGHDILHIRTKWFVPGELLLVLGEVHKEHVRDVILKYLPFREYVRPSFTEKSGDWLAKTFPLERR